jgi:hypothetical protein
MIVQSFVSQSALSLKPFLQQNRLARTSSNKIS